MISTRNELEDKCHAFFVLNNVLCEHCQTLIVGLYTKTINRLYKFKQKTIPRALVNTQRYLTRPLLRTYVCCLPNYSTIRLT